MTEAISVDALATLLTQRIELPSWAFRGGDPRISPHVAAGAPRTPYELLADAAVVHRFTGITPSVGLHLPADKVDDYADLSAHAGELGVRIGSVYPDLNSRAGRPAGICHPEAEVRLRSMASLRDAAAVAVRVGAERLVLRVLDDTPYPGQKELRARQIRLGAALANVRAVLPEQVRIALEYSVVEPCYYTQDVPGWGTAYAQCLPLGPRAQVLLDTVHHAQATSVDFVVGRLLAERRLGGLVVRCPALDDGEELDAATRFELFLVLAEVAAGGAVEPGGPLRTSFVLDPGMNPRPSTLGLIKAVLAVQEATARAVLLGGGRELGTATLLAGYERDVSTLLSAVRSALDVPTDPIEAYHELCRAEHREAERRSAVQRLVARRVAVLLGPTPAETARPA